MEAMEVTEVTAMVTVLMDMEAIIEVCFYKMNLTALEVVP